MPDIWTTPTIEHEDPSGSFGWSYKAVDRAAAPPNWDGKLSSLPALPEVGGYAWLGGSRSPAHDIRTVQGEGAIAMIDFNQRATAFKPGESVLCSVACSYAGKNTRPFKVRCALEEMSVSVHYIPWGGKGKYSTADLKRLFDAGLLVLYRDSPGDGWEPIGGRPPEHQYFLYIRAAKIPRPQGSSRYAVNPHLIPGALGKKPDKDEWPERVERLVRKTLRAPGVAAELANVALHEPAKAAALWAIYSHLA